ncbi:hypothetical protein Taro_006544 [Colocasia esculenta]|uniref:Uncharacterized protein n=1 Tax=Colocasia esculenta TaxID=4460 RepID=A0A843U117_COLES|nr:hypothetical protein [Colocasia esculenta]
MLLRPPASLLPTSTTSRSLFHPSSTAGGRLPLPRRLRDREGLVSFGRQRLAGCSRTSPPARPCCCAVSSPEDVGTAVDRETSVGGGVASAVELSADEGQEGAELSVAVGSPSIPVRLGAIRMSLGDQAFFVLAFISCTTSVAFISLVVALIPTLFDASFAERFQKDKINGGAMLDLSGVVLNRKLEARFDCIWKSLSGACPALESLRAWKRYRMGSCHLGCLAMKRAAISLAKLADTAREELPSTMAAIRLSGMEVSDLTMELSDLR